MRPCLGFVVPPFLPSLLTPLLQVAPPPHLAPSITLWAQNTRGRRSEVETGEGRGERGEELRIYKWVWENVQRGFLLPDDGRYDELCRAKGRGCCEAATLGPRWMRWVRSVAAGRSWSDVRGSLRESTWCCVIWRGPTRFLWGSIKWRRCSSFPVGWPSHAELLAWLDLIPLTKKKMIKKEDSVGFVLMFCICTHKHTQVFLAYIIPVIIKLKRTSLDFLIFIGRMLFD